MTDVSVAKTTRYPDQNEGSSNARTPDNNDVPIKRELNFAGRSDVELGDCLKPNSFLQSSDSLDNNCILNGESVGADFDEDLDRFEGETVARFREDLFLSQKPLTETELRAIASAVSSAKFAEEPKNQGMHVNKRENKSYTGYYSEYFDVHKPVYNKRSIETNSRLIYRSESTEASEPIKSTNKLRKSFREKEISKLISYFESEASKIESSPETPPDYKSKIFEEVSAIRDRERVSKSCVVHSTLAHGFSETDQCNVNARRNFNARSYSPKVQTECKRQSYGESHSTGWRSLDHQEHYSPTSDCFEPDSLEPVRSSLVNSGSADWQSSKSQDSDCSSCTDSLGPVQAKPSQAKHSSRACFDRTSDVTNMQIVQDNHGLHRDPELYGCLKNTIGGSRTKTDQGYPFSMKQEIGDVAQISLGGIPVTSGGGTKLNYTVSRKLKPSAPEPMYRKLAINHYDQLHQSLIVDLHTGITPVRTVPKSESNCCSRSEDSQCAGERSFGSPDHRLVQSTLDQQTKLISVAHCAPEVADVGKPKPKPRHHKPSTPEPAHRRSSNQSVNTNQKSMTSRIKVGSGRDDSLKWNAERASVMQLDLLSQEDQSTAISPNIITPPIGFQNVFPPEKPLDQLGTDAVPVRDAELFTHVSVKNLRNKLSPQNEGWLVHPLSSRTSLLTHLFFYF